MRLQGTWTDGWTDGQGDSYIPPQTLFVGGYNYGQIGDQTGLFYTTNPVFYTSGNRFVRRTGTFGYLRCFHLSHQTTVIQDLLVRRQFSLVPDNRTNVNAEACQMCCRPAVWFHWLD